MKGRVLIAVVLAALAVPAVVLAATPNGQDRENGARACKALRTSMGLENFRLAYGTVQSNRRNAMGRCVSQWAHAEHQARLAARAACEAEQNDPNFPAGHDGKTFKQFYGSFGRCVASKTREARAELRSATLSAVRSCRAERAQGLAEFRAKYGRNANDRNAFGKCVSALAKAQND
jgi:hypothetical protein